MELEQSTAALKGSVENARDEVTFNADSGNASAIVVAEGLPVVVAEGLPVVCCSAGCCTEPSSPIVTTKVRGCPKCKAKLGICRKPGGAGHLTVDEAEVLLLHLNNMMASQLSSNVPVVANVPADRPQRRRKTKSKDYDDLGGGKSQLSSVEQEPRQKQLHASSSAGLSSSPNRSTVVVVKQEPEPTKSQTRPSAGGVSRPRARLFCLLC